MINAFAVKGKKTRLTLASCGLFICFGGKRSVAKKTPPAEVDEVPNYEKMNCSVESDRR